MTSCAYTVNLVVGTIKVAEFKIKIINMPQSQVSLYLKETPKSKTSLLKIYTRQTRIIKRTSHEHP